MVNEHKYVDVNFGRERTARKSGLYQYDYGQILRVFDLELPEYVTVDFSLTDTRGSTETRVGKTTDGCLEVQIPNELLKNSHVSVNTEYYMIYAYIYMSDETSGNTVYKVILQVKTRSKPSDIGTDPEDKKLLDEAVNAVNAAAERAETAEAGARSAADSATAAAESARKSAEAVAQEKNTAISAIQDQQAASEKAITDHTDAEIARQNAATKEATDALTGQITKAGTAGSELKATVEDAGKKKAELEEAIGDADTVKEKVDNSTELAETTKQNLDKSVQEASDQKAELDKTVTRAEELDTSLGEKISEATQLKSDLQTTGEEAVAAINAAGEDNLKQINEAAEKITENIENLTPDDQTVGKNPWSSKQIVDALCPEFEESGNPVTCYPVENYPLDIVASWKPIQEGSGNPYPAGCGPNLLDCSQLSPAAPGYCYGLTVTIDGDVIRIKGVPNITETEQVTSFRYAFIKQDIDIAYKAKAFVTKGSIVGITTVQSDKSLVVTAKVGAGISVDIEMRVMFYAGEEPSIYYAYENIRPIHGRDNVTIERCGKNVLDITQLSPNGYNLAGKNQLRPNTTYTFQPMQCGGISFAIFVSNNINSSQATKQLKLTKRYVDEGKSETFATPADLTDYPYMWLAGGKNGIGGVFPDVQFSLFIGKTEQKPYDPYQGKKQYIPLAQIIYGGSVDNETGDGLISWNILTFTGTENWIYKEDLKIFYINDKNHAEDTAPVSSHYTGRNTLYIQNYEVGVSSGAPAMIFVRDDRFVAVESWKAYLAAQYAAGTPVQIAYKLAEPIPFQVDGDQIPALKGINNILTDADTVTVTGREDPVHYVDKKFAELSAAIVASASEAE